MCHVPPGKFHGTFESHIRSLASLDKDVNSYALLLVPILSKKPSSRRLEELQETIQSEIHIFLNLDQTIDILCVKKEHKNAITEEHKNVITN